jgi:hypothetical protein
MCELPGACNGDARMSVRYWVEVSDYLAANMDRWPAGLRPVWRGSRGSRGTHWWLFEDDDAPPELDGKLVELSITVTKGRLPVVTSRQETVQLRPRSTLARDPWDRVAVLVAECEAKGIPVPRGMPVIDEEHLLDAVAMLARLLRR